MRRLILRTGSVLLKGEGMPSGSSKICFGGLPINWPGVKSKAPVGDKIISSPLGPVSQAKSLEVSTKSF